MVIVMGMVGVRGMVGVKGVVGARGRSGMRVKGRVRGEWRAPPREPGVAIPWRDEPGRPPPPAKTPVSAAWWRYGWG